MYIYCVLDKVHEKISKKVCYKACYSPISWPLLLVKIALGNLTYLKDQWDSFNKIFNIIYKINPKTNDQITPSEKVSEMDQDL